MMIVHLIYSLNMYGVPFLGQAYYQKLEDTAMSKIDTPPFSMIFSKTIRVAVNGNISFFFYG